MGIGSGMQDEMRGETPFFVSNIDLLICLRSGCKRFLQGGFPSCQEVALEKYLSVTFT